MQQRTKRIFYYSFFTIAIISCLLNGWGIINTMVSLKYETTFENTCISTVTGDNLCNQLMECEIISLVSLIVSIGMIAFKMKIIKPEISN